MTAPLFQHPFSAAYLTYFAAILGLSLFFCVRPNQRGENFAFWILGFILIAFTLFRPMGLGIDDLAYVRISNEMCAFPKCIELFERSRDFAWYQTVSFLKSLTSGPQAVLMLAAITVFLQLFIIHSLCKQKILALLFFVSHVYLLFDFTIFRAGFALTAYFLAIYLLVCNRKFLGSSLLAGNFIFHSQGIFSLGLLPMRWIAHRKVACLMIGAICLLGIYLHLTPSIHQISFFSKAEASDYIAKAVSGEFRNDNAFPQFGLVLVAFISLTYLFNKKLLDAMPVNDYVLASAILALCLSWFFASIIGIQLRLFEFYIAPMIFLAGNLKRNLWSFSLGALTAIVLVARLVLMRNFILG